MERALKKWTDHELNAEHLFCAAPLIRTTCEVSAEVATLFSDSVFDKDLTAATFMQE